MPRNILQLQSPGVEAEKRTLVLASLKLLLFILLLSFCLTEIVFLTGDNMDYGGKGQTIAFYCCVSVFSAGMILDASYVLGKKKQSAAAEKRRGMGDTFLRMFVLLLSPLRLLDLVSIAAAAGMIGSAISFLFVMF